MHFDIKIYKTENISDVIKFLNSKAKDFYQSKHTFKSGNFETFFKANLQVAMVDIERTIRGTFGCDIFMKYADHDFVSQLFPNAYTNIFRVKDKNDFKLMGRALETLRNINSHARLTERDYLFFDTDYSFLEFEPKMNRSLKYYNEGITIAGVIYIVCNMLRERSLSDLIKSDFLFSLVISGQYKYDDGTDFVKKISHVNLELPIRKEIGTMLKDAIFGDYKKYASINGDEFTLMIGSPKYPTTMVSGICKNNEILIQKNSLSRTFYPNDFDLKIEDIDGFIELSNKLPSFALVDYLYESKISIFSKEEYEYLNQNFNMISKLNYPKFYTNKNVRTILLPKTISDFTMLSTLFADSLLKYLLMLEAYIYNEREFEQSKNVFSSIGYALHGICVSQEIIVDIKFLRNFVAHGYILNESLLYDGEAKQYTIEFVLNCLKELVVYFKEHDEQLYVFSKKFLKKLFIEKMVNAKYKKAFSLSHDIAKTYPKYDKKDFFIKNNFIDHSYMEITTLNDVNNLIGGGTYVLKIHIKGLGGCLYLKNLDPDVEAFNELCIRCNLKIKKEKDEGLVHHYYLV